MYYANHGYEYVICGMETLDLILLFAGSGLAWKNPRREMKLSTLCPRLNVHNYFVINLPQIRGFSSLYFAFIGIFCVLSSSLLA